MPSRVIIAILSTLLFLLGVGYINKDAARKDKPKGQVDLGSEVSFNVYVATVKLSLNLREADLLVI